jgi:predicted pyridoxine 5'-phosphate oxidase superfamily flavin-nucleotide-binding protein
VNRYARVDAQNRVQEIVEAEDHVEPSALHFPGYPLIKLENNSKAQQRWIWDGENFIPPRDAQEVLLKEAANRKKSWQTLPVCHP